MATSLNSLLVGAQEELDKLKDQDDRLAAEICHMQSEVAAKQTEQDAVRQRINAIENAQEAMRIAIQGTTTSSFDVSPAQRAPAAFASSESPSSSTSTFQQACSVLPRAQDSGPQLLETVKSELHSHATPTPTKNSLVPSSSAPIRQSSLTSESDAMQTTPTANKVDPTKFNLITAPGQLYWSAMSRAKGIEGFEVVQLMDGKWTEISCGVCGRNATKHGKSLEYIGHVQGLYNHIALSHFKGRTDLSFEDKFAHIKRREVSQEDVDLMLAGKAPKVEIPMDLGPEIVKSKPGKKRKTEDQPASSPCKKPNNGYDGGMQDDEEPSQSLKTPTEIFGWHIATGASCVGRSSK